MRKTQKAATQIQKVVRKLLVQVVLDKLGRSYMKKFKEETSRLIARKSEMKESEFIARCSVITGKSRVAMAKHRDRNMDIRKMSLSHKKSRHQRQLERENMALLKGTVQPARLSVFEPMAFALKRLAAAKPARYGTKTSAIISQMQNAKRALEKDLSRPDAGSRTVHAAARRGIAIIAARRLARRPKKSQNEDQLIQNTSFQTWCQLTLAPAL
jgi:hypothetical protein